MSFETHVVIADSDDAEALANSDSPTLNRVGFTFTGLDRVQVCTLLSLLSTGSSETEFDRYLDAIKVFTSDAGDWPVVSVLNAGAVAELATIAGLDESDFNRLANSWAGTDEFEGWQPTDTRDLLAELGDLACSAADQQKCIVIWQST